MHDHAPIAAARRAGRALVLPALICALACAGCAGQTEPTSVVVLPGLTKTYGQFQADDAACRADAARASGRSATPGGSPAAPPGASPGVSPGAQAPLPGTGTASVPPAVPPAGAPPAGVPPVGTPPAGTPAGGTVARTLPPEQVYANCMTARGNMLQAGGTADDLGIGYDSTGYAAYSPGYTAAFLGGGYPAFNDYYPWEYGDTLGYDFWGAPLFFGWGGFGGGYFGGRYWGGRYWPGHYFGGHPWGMYHGFHGGFFHGGYHGGGFHGGGFHGGGFHGGGGGHH